VCSAGAADPVPANRDEVDGEELHPRVEYSKREMRRASFWWCFLIGKVRRGAVAAEEELGTFLADELREEYGLPSSWCISV
jgi:hypothetical protein